MSRRAYRMLLERDVAEIERRLKIYRSNSPKRIAQDLGVHVNTVTTINLGRHAVQLRLRREYQRMVTALEIASRALQDLSEDGKEPGYTRALGNVGKSLDEIAAGLEAGTLEDRALAIARAKLKE